MPQASSSLASQPSLASAVEVEEEVKFSKEELATLTTAAEVEKGLLAGSSRREQALLWKVAAVERALACEVTARKDAVEELATLRVKREEGGVARVEEEH